MAEVCAKCTYSERPSRKRKDRKASKQLYDGAKRGSRARKGSRSEPRNGKGEG